MVGDDACSVCVSLIQKLLEFLSNPLLQMLQISALKNHMCKFFNAEIWHLLRSIGLQIWRRTDSMTAKLQSLKLRK
jgi:predicted Na+-dependent transporter